MVGFILLKTLLKVAAVSVKSTAAKKAAINGVIVASGLSEIERNQRFNKPKEKFKNTDEQIEIIDD